MRRVQWFEFNDQSWLPRRWRGYLTDLLDYQISAYGLYAPAVGKLRDALQKTGCREIVDFGSGGGGAILEMQKLLLQAGYAVNVTLTDKFPDRDVITRVNVARAIYETQSVDAADATAYLSSRSASGVAVFRTFFTCFHHFTPAFATRVLKNAVDDCAPIGIFEFTERRPANLTGMLLAPLLVWANTAELSPSNWGRIFWTYILPVVPLLYWWDGTVSHLRTYSVPELHDLSLVAGGGDYHWECGRIDGRSSAITYLIGHKRS